MSPSVLDLFCGAGGFSTGFMPYSCREHIGIDNDPFALATYSANHPHSQAVLGDISRLHSQVIRNLLGNDPEIVIASPPCEEFSMANPDSDTHVAERVYGAGSARLLVDTIRLVGDLNPAVFIIENVAALMKSGGRDLVIEEFERVGIPDVHFNLIRAHLHGNPSKRLRLFMSNRKLILPKSNAPRVMDVIGDLPSLGIEAILSPGDTAPNHETRPLSPENLKQVSRTRHGRGTKSFRVRDRNFPNWVRLAPDKVSTSINGLSRYVHPYENRLLTVREHARLMSYDDSFIFTGPIESQYNQVGESVPPLISRLIAQEVIMNLE